MLSSSRKSIFEDLLICMFSVGIALLQVPLVKGQPEKANNYGGNLRQRWGNICVTFQEAKRMYRRGEPAAALKKYRKGLKRLQKFHKENPAWKKNLVKKQITRIQRHVQEIKAVNIGGVDQDDKASARTASGGTKESPEEDDVNGNERHLKRIIHVQRELLQHLNEGLKRKEFSGDNSSTADNSVSDELSQKIRKIQKAYPATEKEQSNRLSAEAVEAITELGARVARQKKEIAALREELRSAKKKQEDDHEASGTSVSEHTEEEVNSKAEVKN